MHTHTSEEFWNTWKSRVWLGQVYQVFLRHCTTQKTCTTHPPQSRCSPHCAPVNTAEKKKSGKRRKPLCHIFIMAHDKRRHVTSRQTFIASEAIPFGPQTHHTLRRGFSAGRQRLPHPSDIPEPKDTDLCHSRATAVGFALHYKPACPLLLFTSSQRHHNSISHPIQHLLCHSGSLCPALYLNLALVTAPLVHAASCGQKQGTCGFPPPHPRDPTTQG